MPKNKFPFTHFLLDSTFGTKKVQFKGYKWYVFCVLLRFFSDLSWSDPFPNFVSVKISPPRLGGSGFGKIVIERKKSIYKPVFDHAE